MAGSERAGFRQIGERERLPGSWIRFMTGTFVAPDGFTFERDYIRHPGAVCIVPLEDDGVHILIERQYRPVLDRFVFELPAGKMDVPGEEPERCAYRELIEEIGRKPASLTELVTFYNSPGFTDEKTTCFLAEGLTEVDNNHQGIEESYMTVERIKLADVETLVEKGSLTDAKSIIAARFAVRALEARDGLSGGVS